MNLEDAHLRLMTALNAARMVAWDMDLATGCCLREGAFACELGLTELTAEAFYAVVYPEDLPRVREAIGRAATGERSYELEFRLKTRDGRVLWVRDCAQLIRDATGRPARLSGMMIDISPLKQMENRLAAVLSSIGDHLVTYDRQWRYTYVNEGGARMLGMAPEGLLGRCIWELFPNAIGNRYYEECHEALREQKVIRSEFYYPPFDKWFENHMYPSPEGLTVFSADITARKNAEEARRKSDERLRMVTDHLPALVAYIDRNGTFQFANLAYHTWFGLQPDLMVGRHVCEILEADLRHAHTSRADQVLQGNSVCFETCLPHCQLGRRHVELTCIPDKSPGGSVPGYYVMAHDLTERVEAERAARERELRFQFVARATNDVIWDWDLRSGAVAWNEAVLANFGYAQNEMGTHPEGKLSQIHPEERDRVARGIQEAINGKAEIWQDEYRFLCGDGSYRVFLDRGFIARDAEGKAIRMIGAMLDVTVKKRAEEKLEAAVAERTARLRETIAELEAFSYSISHDMRGPLRAMQGYAKALLEDAAHKLGETERDYLSRIARAAHRLDRLIRDVLDYSRLARGTFEVEPIKLEKLIDEIVQQYPLLRGPEIEIEVARPLPAVLGHEVLLTQCLSNLLGNAVKFMAPGQAPRVRVRSESAGGSVRLFVEDNGIGIEPHNHTRVFGIFQRINPDSAYEGTGIGLAIVKKAVERMGGEVGLESNLGQGSRFWIKLQMATE